MLVYVKPPFLYDNEKQQYKEFGSGENQTLFTLPVVAIFLAIVVSIVAMSFKSKNIINKSSVPEINYKFIPVPVYYQQPMVQVPFSQVSPELTQQLGKNMPFQNMQGMQNFQGMSKMPGMQNFQNMQGMQGMSGMQGMQNFPNMQGMSGIPNFQNMQGMSGMPITQPINVNQTGGGGYTVTPEMFLNAF
jgi:hypothetical protein